jgi:hypothetical protein
VTPELSAIDIKLFSCYNVDAFCIDIHAAVDILDDWSVTR